MIDKAKLEKLHTMSENLYESAGDDKRLRNCATIFQLLLTHIDDLQEELDHVRDENEAMMFALEDKKFEESGSRRRTVGLRRNPTVRTAWDDAPF